MSALVEALNRAVGDFPRPLALHEPLFRGREHEYLRRCLDSGWVSTAGPYVGEFEGRIAKTCGVKKAVAVVNGTAALHIALYLAGVQPGDEVVIPSLTFVATANAVAYCGATPHFVDIDEERLSIDPEKLRTLLSQNAVRSGELWVNRRTNKVIRAVVTVHVFGHPAQMHELSSVCNEFGLPLIEDATESLGSTYHGRPCGGLGSIGVLSFNGNKIVTTGGGGALLFQDEERAELARHLTTTAKRPHRWAFVHDEIGWNYRMPNLNAALGIAQLEQLDAFVSAKRALAERYSAAVEGLYGVQFVREPPGTNSNYWLVSIMLADASGAARDALLEATHEAGLLTRPVWTPMHELDMFKYCPRGDLSVTTSVERRLVSLPSSAVLGMGYAA